MDSEAMIHGGAFDHSTLDRTLAMLMRQPGRELASLAVVLVKADQVVYEGYFGSRWFDPANQERSLPATPATKFRVASISKLVASLAFMQLVERGLVGLNDDVSDLLGFRLRNPHFPTTPITPAMLLSHTSSLRDGSLYSAAPPHTLRDFFHPGGALYENGAHFAAPHANLKIGSHGDAENTETFSLMIMPRRSMDTDMTHAPGRFFSYCNLNFGVLGAIIERVSGERFDLYVHDHILHPLEIDGGFNVNLLSDEGFGQIAVLYRKQRDGVWTPDGPWVAQVDDYQGRRPLLRLDDYSIGTNGTIFSPQGGLRISARDLVKVMRLFMHGGRCGDMQIVQPATMAQMLTVRWRYDPAAPNGDPYNGLMRAWGLGPQRTTAVRDALGGDRHIIEGSPQLWGHAGDAYGLLAGLWCDPSIQSGFIYIIGGVGADPEANRGRYSSFYRWEEEIQTAIIDSVYTPLDLDASLTRGASLR
jgi:CubicO group peptidase (beta-lactamase class C family)